MLEFIFRCRHRLKALGFDQDGTIYRAIDKAYSALNDLHVTLHRQSRGRGVGKPPENE